MAIFRSKPFVAGAIFWTYQDYRTRSGFVMGLRDAERNRRGSWWLLREEYAPVRIEGVELSAASAGRRSATVALRTRGPVDLDMPAYTLRGYRLHWVVRSSQGDTVFAEGDLALPVLEPGAAWSGQVDWAVPQAEYLLTLSIVRPTGFAVLEQWYNERGELLPAGGP
jgi:beta-glucuronidase